MCFLPHTAYVRSPLAIHTLSPHIFALPALPCVHSFGQFCFHYKKTWTKTRWDYPDKVGESKRVKECVWPFFRQRISKYRETDERAHIRRMEKLLHFKVHLARNDDEKNRTNEKEEWAWMRRLRRTDRRTSEKKRHTHTHTNEITSDDTIAYTTENIVLRNWIVQKWMVIMAHI